VEFQLLLPQSLPLLHPPLPLPPLLPEDVLVVVLVVAVFVHSLDVVLEVEGVQDAVVECLKSAVDLALVHLPPPLLFQLFLLQQSQLLLQARLLLQPLLLLHFAHKL